ncbi:unnamed protein product [Effrenium voratum]|nr:unnamed protein product [Effrenium voratum]
MNDIWREFAKGAQYLTDQIITTYQNYVPEDVPEPDPKSFFPVGVSAMIMKEENLCHTARCRLQVAQSKGGDYAFAVDRNGFHWKCVNRRQIKGEPGHLDYWACIPLACFTEEGTLESDFKFEEDCKLPNIIANDDGAPVPDAPEDAEEYNPIELLKRPLRSDEMSIPADPLLAGDPDDCIARRRSGESVFLGREIGPPEKVAAVRSPRSDSRVYEYLQMVEALPVSTFGKGDKDVLFFVHGWPDDANLWRAQVEHFKEIGHVCKCVTMPHFGGRQSAEEQHYREAYDFHELADILAATLRAECREPVTLVLHDWGCVWGFLLQHRHPGLVDKIVALDVGHPWCLSGWPMLLGFVSYQFWLFAAFLLRQATRHLPLLESRGRRVADAMVHGFLRLLGRNVEDRITADACYPYFYYITRWGVPEAPALQEGVMLPSCPCLFVYGLRKKFRFHRLEWEQHLRSRSECHVVALDAGHWLQEEKPAEVNRAIAEWLANSSEKASVAKERCLLLGKDTQPLADWGRMVTEKCHGA